MSKSKSGKISLSHLFFLLSGVFFVVYYLLSEGMPSFSGILPIFKFVVELFVLLIVIFFYGFFLFQSKGSGGVSRSIAPSLLVLILVGGYSMNFGSPEANGIITSIATLFYVLIVACGFVFLFVHSKILGYAFSYSSLVYACFVSVSYLVVMIISLVNNGAFSLTKLMETLFFLLGLVFLFLGGERVSRRKELLM